MQQKRSIQIIEWEDLDKHKFYSFGVFITIAIRATVYPATLIRVVQSITVPIDVISQQLMMQGQGEHLTRFKDQPKTALGAKHSISFGQTRDIIAQIFAADGICGFCRGYVASLLTYIPNSAVWWPFYHFYMVLQAMAGPLAAATASTMTNPTDVITARVQVEGRTSVIETFNQLIREEGFWGMTKGLSARIITPTAIVMVVGYETLKKLSLRPSLLIPDTGKKIILTVS